MIFLMDMNEEEYQNYISEMLPGYCEEVAKALGISDEEARKIGEKQISDSLVNGMNTPQNYFYLIKKNKIGAVVGYLWLLIKGKEDNKTLFIADIIVKKNFRGEKIGTKTLECIEEKAKEFNCKTVSLHVFGHNFGARKLYESLGYEAFSIHMKKDVL